MGRWILAPLAVALALCTTGASSCETSNSGSSDTTTATSQAHHHKRKHHKRHHRRKRRHHRHRSAAAASPPTTETTPQTTESSCDPSYKGACLDPSASDYDCEGGSGNGPKYVSGPIKVVGDDHFGLDSDGDGTACES